MNGHATLVFALAWAAAPTPAQAPFAFERDDERVDLLGAAARGDGAAGRALSLPAGDAAACARLRTEVDFAADFTVLLWVRTAATGSGFPALAGNKDWHSGTVRDETSHHALGSTRSSGGNPGWVLALQPGGSWTWNVGDGRGRRDYRPTATRQPVNDDRWHQLGFAVVRARNEARLYRDGRNVAIYDLTGLGALSSELPVCVGSDGRGLESPGRGAAGAYDEVEILSRALSDAEVGARFRRVRPEVELPARPTQEVPQLSVLAWNIWHGGRRDGNEIGLGRTVAAIEASGADVVCMQETYGSGPAIADGLGFYLYLRSSNISVMSRYPLGSTRPLSEPFRFGGVEVLLGPGQRLAAFSLWINHLPGYGRDAQKPGATAQRLVAAEAKTRHAEIRGILAALEPVLAEAEQVPVVVAGDFNSASHLDWVEATAERHYGLVVPWPVSREMQAAGFTDAFRAVHPDPARAPGRTWSPRFVDTHQDRIDYVYWRGGLEVVDAAVLDRHAPRWPSDHAAVLAKFRLR